MEFLIDFFFFFLRIPCSNWDEGDVQGSVGACDDGAFLSSPPVFHTIVCTSVLNLCLNDAVGDEE